MIDLIICYSKSRRINANLVDICLNKFKATGTPRLEIMICSLVKVTLIRCPNSQWPMIPFYRLEWMTTSCNRHLPPWNTGKYLVNWHFIALICYARLFRTISLFILRRPKSKLPSQPKRMAAATGGLSVVACVNEVSSP